MEFSNQIVNTSKRFRPVWFRIIALMLFWVVFFIVVDPLAKSKIDQYDSITEVINYAQRRGVSPNITKDAVISQAIIPTKDNWVGIGVFFGTYMRINNSSFSISILDSEGTEVFQTVVDASILNDNSYYTVYIPRQVKVSGKRYELKITGIDGEEGNSPTIWVTDVADAETVYVNGEQTDYVLDVILLYEQKWIYPVFFGLIVVLSFVFICIVQKADERTFIYLCFLLGVLFVIINPFRHPLDEDTHFLKSYAISRLNLFEDVVEDRVGFLLPSSVENSVSYRNFGLTKNTDLLYKSSNSEIGFIDNRYATSIIPINHSVAAVGLLIARLLHLSVGLTIWFGRLTNYVFYVVVCYFAIKNARYYKSLFFVVATLPAALWMAASYSTDPVLLSTSLLFVSICLKYFFADKDSRITNLDLALLLCCGISIASVKYFVYLPILTCFYMIPRKCFVKHQRRNMIIAAIMVVILLAAWEYALLKHFPLIEDRNGNVNIAEQIRFMFGNIGFTIKNILNYFVSNIVWILENTSYTSALPSISSLIGVLCILSAVIAQDKYPKEHDGNIRLVRLHCLLIFIIISMLIIVALYVAYTPIGEYGVDGVQPRYFQPVLLFFMLPLALTRIKNTETIHDDILLVMVECHLLLSLTGTLMNAMMP